MDKQLKGELWEIQGLLYIIAGLFINNWIAYLFTGYGVFTIIGGFVKQYQGFKEEQSVLPTHSLEGKETE